MRLCTVEWATAWLLVDWPVARGHDYRRRRRGHSSRQVPAAHVQADAFNVPARHDGSVSASFLCHPRYFDLSSFIELLSKLLVNSGTEQERTLVRIQFTPHGLMYSTPQKRCCVREVPKEGDVDLGLTKVLDMREVVQRCLDQEVTPHVREIERLTRAIGEISKLRAENCEN